MINEKYSYNGYNPESQAVKNKKVELKQKLLSKQIIYKEYSAQISAMKRGFKYMDLTKELAKDFNNTEIIGSSFAQREPFTDVFPSDMTGVTFINCNLNNCNIPVGNTVEGGTNKHHKTQNDCEEWVVDAQLKPIEPLSPERYDKFGLSKNPKDISATPLIESIIGIAEKEKVKADRKAKILEVAGNPTLLDELINSGKEL